MKPKMQNYLLILIYLLVFQQALITKHGAGNSEANILNVLKAAGHWYGKRY